MEPVRKTPTEILPTTIDWSDRISSTLTISSATAAAQNLETGATATSDVFDSATGTVSSFNVTWTLKAGQTDGQRFLLTYTATASDATIYQAFHELQIRSPYA